MTTSDQQQGFENADLVNGSAQPQRLVDALRGGDGSPRLPPDPQVAAGPPLPAVDGLATPSEGDQDQADAGSLKDGEIRK